MSSTSTIDQVDVRGPRFAAWITTGVLVITLIVSGISSPAAAVILGLQAVVFAVIGTAGFAAGAPLVGLIAAGAALVAAFLNAAFGICLGCQLYPLVVHLKPTARTSEPAQPVFVPPDGKDPPHPPLRPPRD